VGGTSPPPDGVVQWYGSPVAAAGPRNVAVEYLDDGTFAVVTFTHRLKRADAHAGETPDRRPEMAEEQKAVAETTAPEEALAIAEKEALAELEEVIKRGREAFIEVAEALQAIRAGRLYRDTHATFEDYVRDRWSMSGAYAYQVMNAGKTVKELPEGTPKPQNEGQARELAKVPTEARRR